MRLCEFGLLAALLTLGACSTTGYDLSTPEGQALYQRDLAVTQQGLQQSSIFLGQAVGGLQQQAAQAPASTQVAPYGQQPSTAIVYCRDLTGSLIACKQVN